MAEQRNNNNRWNWEVSGFEPRKLPSSSTSAAVAASSFDHHHDNYKPGAPLVRRYSISAASALAQSELANSNSNNQAVASKLQKLKDKVKLAREDYLELRQEASELHEYSNAKLERATRYLGVLVNKTRKLDQFALETEARISPLINEKRRLFNDLLTAKAELFHDDQPLVQSALGGYNVSIFAYGQTNSGKTHTMDGLYWHGGLLFSLAKWSMPFNSVPLQICILKRIKIEGSSHDRGLCARSFEELFDLSNSDSTSTSRFKFSVTVFELYNEQIRDLLSESGDALPKIRMGSPESFVELVQEKVDNPLDFSKVLKAAFQSRGNKPSKFNVSHFIESKLSEALHSSEDQSPLVLDPGSAILSNSKAMGDGMDSPVTTNLEEELKKRDALIERLHEENEKLFDRLTEKTSLAGSPKLSSPLSKGQLNVQSRDLVRNDSRGHSMDIVSSSIALAADETEGTVALVKSSVEKVKTTPAGEYLTSALNDFDPEQHDSLAVISDGANKLLMLVCLVI
ncbi:hypothetical protein C1H46_000151 [Malus baccata]|uniref:Kinesin motor domain-containing protein n=1 Tax=Malus baccata TaxID=106549 RepID=A0A540NT63_MALBA|nr:hypothetical protein C1H46_000151 [Malus baccata]